ncbi:hypothetical protein WR25_15903 [Diploscapter pachys]|uniref:Uncharacterized protein n=1 Tax=Diploscapter pachys TaxID=2018661 RepID=A0A2A2M4P9_9BILA|nr:hypothetical protein WR25_15903 [Diploscapter pachys]
MGIQVHQPLAHGIAPMHRSLPDLLAGLDRASGADTPGQQQCFAVRAMGVEQPMGLAQVHRQAPTLTGAQFRPGKPAKLQAPGQLRPARLSMLQLETHAALRASRQPHHPPLQPHACCADQQAQQPPSTNQPSGQIRVRRQAKASNSNGISHPTGGKTGKKRRLNSPSTRASIPARMR